jgi:CBS domain-containing protein
MTRLPVHGRIHVRRDQTVASSGFVRCSDDLRWVPREACQRCAKSGGGEDGVPTCERPDEAYAPPERASITEVMDANVLCADAEATVEVVQAALAAHGAPVAVVLDAGGHAIGVCSRFDLALGGPAAAIQTCMTPFVITMLDSTTVADALELVIERDLHHIPILSEGRVVGLVTPRAVIRWLAHSLRAACTSRACDLARREDVG